MDARSRRNGKWVLKETVLVVQAPPDYLYLEGFNTPRVAFRQYRIWVGGKAFRRLRRTP